MDGQVDVFVVGRDFSDADFAKYQRRLASQSRRLDGIDAWLIGLAALQFAAMLYVGVNESGETWAFRIAAGIIAVCIFLDLVAVIGHESRESPDLASFEMVAATRGRPMAMQEAMRAMINDYIANDLSIVAKQRTTRWGAIITGCIVLVTVIWRTIH